MQEVKKERTGWRDKEISELHRKWGWDCPAIDIDFLMIEYNKGAAIALVEYKHENAQKINLLHPSYLAITELANKAQVPFFVCKYASDYSTWEITPINDFAKKYLSEMKKMSQFEWVAFLYKLRGLFFNKTQLTL